MRSCEAAHRKRWGVLLPMLGSVLAAVTLGMPAEARAEESTRRVTPAELAAVRCDPPPACDPCARGLATGYDRKLYLRYEPAGVEAVLGGYTQLRWTGNRRFEPSPGETEKTSDLRFARSRVWLDLDLDGAGFFETRWDIDRHGEASAVTAYLELTPVEGWSLVLGKQFVAVLREDWMYPEDLLTLDYSGNDTAYAIGTPVAIQLHRELRRDRVWAALSNGAFAGGKDADPVDEAAWAISGRYEHQWRTTDWGTWDDLIGRRGRACGFLFGVGGGLQGGHAESGAILAGLVTADLSWSWNGGQALVYGVWRRAETRRLGTFNNWGFLAQAGHFVTNNLQIYARYELVSPGSVDVVDFDTYQSVVAGVGFYPFRWTNRLRAAIELGRLFGPFSSTIVPENENLGFLPSERGDQVYVQVQVQVGF